MSKLDLHLMLLALDRSARPPPHRGWLARHLVSLRSGADGIAGLDRRHNGYTASAIASTFLKKERVGGGGRQGRSGLYKGGLRLGALQGVST